MEKYDSGNKRPFQIVGMSHSIEDFHLTTSNYPDEVRFSFLPFLIVDTEKSIAAPVLKAVFIDSDNSPISNEFSFQVVFKFEERLPVCLNKQNQVDVANFNDLVAIFDTTIGAFRGVFFDWLKDTKLQRPLPFVDVPDFIKALKVSFVK